MRELTADEVGWVSGGDVVSALEDIFGGLTGVGGGVGSIADGFAVDSAVIGGFMIGGGALAVAGGIGLIALGGYELYQHA